MSFNLESLGIKLQCPKKTNYHDNIIKYCLNKINNQDTHISPQLLLVNKDELTPELLNIIQNNLARNLLNKRKYLLKLLTPSNFEEKITNFLYQYCLSLKHIDITLRLSNLELPLNKYGNSNFIQKNLETLGELIISNPKIRKLFNQFIIDNVWNGSSKSYFLFKILNNLEEYNLIIFDDFSQDLLEWFNYPFDIPDEYPLYMKDIYKLNYNIYRCNKIKNFINKNFPKKSYSNIYIPILNTIFENNFTNLLKHKNIGFFIILKFLDKLIKLLDLVSDSKKDYYHNIITNKLQQIIKSIKNIENIENITDLLYLYENYTFIQPEVGNIFNKYKNSKIINNCFQTILKLSTKDILIFSEIINNFVSTSNILIKLKHQLSEVIWSLNDIQIEKIKIFNRNLYCNKKDKNLEIINSIIKDKIQSDQINILINPHKVYHFSRGIWDFPMNNNYFSDSVFNNLPLKEELNALYINLDSLRKELIVFSTKGQVIYEFNDDNDKLIGKFLPVQAMLIKQLLDKQVITIEQAEQLCLNSGVKNFTKVFETLSDLINISSENISLKEKLPYYGEKNFSELFFTETKKIMEKKIKVELILSLKECMESNICSILKKEENKTLTLNKLEIQLKEKINKYHSFTSTEFNQIIENMIERDYLVKSKDSKSVIWIVY